MTVMALTTIADALTGHLRRQLRGGDTANHQGRAEQAEKLAAQIKVAAAPESHRRLLFTEVRRLESTARRLAKSASAIDKNYAERVAYTAAQLRRIASATE